MKICVYGASSNTIDVSYISAGELLGAEIAKRNHVVIYGGGAEGMMGAVARGARSEDGEVIGIAPSFFKVDGCLYENCTEFIYTETMRSRKKLLEDKSDAFLVTPGGIGTFDEFFEIITLRQLGQHLKPIAIYNINGYFNPMIEMMKNAINQSFMTAANEELYFVSEDANAVLNYIETHKPEILDLSTLKDVK